MNTRSPYVDKIKALLEKKGPLTIAQIEKFFPDAGRTTIRSCVLRMKTHNELVDVDGKVMERKNEGSFLLQGVWK